MVRTLAATNLGFEYPIGRRALQAVELALAPGELVCLIGPNGSGKSTLLRLLGGLLAPLEGSVALGGRPLAALGARERARELAFVPQSLFGLPELPNAKQLTAIAEVWRPYRTVACWYLWRSRGFVPRS